MPRDRAEQPQKQQSSEPQHGVFHFGAATAALGDLSERLPLPDDGVSLESLASFEAAVADLLEQPAGVALCRAYGSRRGCLLRFLQARDADEQRASEMIRATAAFRHVNQVNNLNSITPCDLRSQIIARLRPYWPGYCVGITRDGSPLLYTKIGLFNPLIYDFEEEALRLLYVGWMDRGLQLQALGCAMAQDCKKASAVLPQNIEVFDFMGLSAFQLAAKTLLMVRSLAFLAIGTTHYPEHLRKCFIVNAPSVFTLFTNIVLKRLPPATRRKIECTSHENYHAFREFMEPEQIEEMFRYSVTAPEDHEKAVAEVRELMACWKEQQGLKCFGSL